MTAFDTTVSTLLVAIDNSKHRHEVLIGTPGKKRKRRMTITNSLGDFQRLAAVLSGYGLPGAAAGPLAWNHLLPPHPEAMIPNPRESSRRSIVEGMPPVRDKAAVEFGAL
ncbi:hypothetical protein [Cribrihabitans pelagius]|uniref:hypothetical protein n=1 Tax=Cribrihabitans pelagius TaxID=1765746 RepID=UPI003B5C12FB